MFQLLFLLPKEQQKNKCFTFQTCFPFNKSYLLLYLSLTWFIITHSSTTDLMFRYIILHIIYYA